MPDEGQLIGCRECGHRVAFSANSCPGCGARTPWRRRSGIVEAVVLGVVLLFLVTWLSACGSEGPTGPNGEEPHAPAVGAYLVDAVFLRTVQGEQREITEDVTLWVHAADEAVASGTAHWDRATVIFDWASDWAGTHYPVTLVRQGATLLIRVGPEGKTCSGSVTEQSGDSFNTIRCTMVPG